VRWSAAPSNRCPGHRIHAHCCKSRYFERLLLCVSGVILGPESIGFTQMVAEFLHCGSVQVWRPLRGPVHDSPLGILDAATVAKDDLIPYSLIFPGRKGYNYAAKYNPDHRQVQLLCPVCTTSLQCLHSAQQNIAASISLRIAVQSSCYMPLPAESFVSVCKSIHILSEQTKCDAAKFLPSFSWLHTLRRYVS
jgi:hypothetical protein